MYTIINVFYFYLVINFYCICNCDCNLFGECNPLNPDMLLLKESLIKNIDISLTLDSIKEILDSIKEFLI